MVHTTETLQVTACPKQKRVTMVRLDVVKAKQLWTATASSALMKRFADEIKVKNREKAEFLVYQTDGRKLYKGRNPSV